MLLYEISSTLYTKNIEFGQIYKRKRTRFHKERSCSHSHHHTQRPLECKGISRHNLQGSSVTIGGKRRFMSWSDSEPPGSIATKMVYCSRFLKCLGRFRIVRYTAPALWPGGKWRAPFVEEGFFVEGGFFLETPFFLVAPFVTFLDRVFEGIMT